MHVVIVGCGRVGSTLAKNLIADDHTVSIIDKRAGAFERLGPDFSGRTVLGIGFDRDRLIDAGIERANAVAAVTSGDNSNLLVARVDRETFGDALRAVGAEPRLLPRARHGKAAILRAEPHSVTVQEPGETGRYALAPDGQGLQAGQVLPLPVELVIAAGDQAAAPLILRVEGVRQ